MVKIAILMLLIFALIFLWGCQPDTAPDTTPPDTTEEPSESSAFTVFVDGEEKEFTKEPVVQNDIMLASISDISNFVGIEFRYDESEKLITAATDDYSLEFTVDSTKANASRRSYTIDAAPKVVDGCVMVPIDFALRQLGFEIAWDTDDDILTIEKLKLTYDEPDTDYQSWAIARARQLTEFTFTPLRDIPTVTSDGKAHDVFEAGKAYKGFPYSSTERNDKFICENVSFETFLSALSNPDSVLYTKDMYHGNNASTYYGIVCNGLVRYCLGIKYRCNTQNWYKIPGMNKVAEKGEYTVDDLELCDVLHAHGNGVNHVAMITGILRDESGKIVKVEVTDAIMPTCRRRLNSVEDFNAWIEKYSLCRYDNMDSVPELDEDDDRILFESGIDKMAPKIAVDYGDKSNYMIGDKTVISSFAVGENTVQIFRDGELIEEISVNGYKKLTRKLEGGYYVVKLAGTEHQTEFAVCDPNITHTYEDGVITIYADSGDPQSKVIHMEFRRKGTVTASLDKMVELTDEEKAGGIIVRKVPSTSKTYKVSFENKYGIWTHTIIAIEE